MPFPIKIYHSPVLIEKIASIIQSNFIQKLRILDVTLGEGGYAKTLFDMFYDNIYLYLGVGLDIDILKIARKRLSIYSNKLLLLSMNFKDIVSTTFITFKSMFFISFTITKQ